jgi:hypothetical protein
MAFMYVSFARAGNELRGFFWEFIQPVEIVLWISAVARLRIPWDGDIFDLTLPVLPVRVKDGSVAITERAIVVAIGAALHGVLLSLMEEKHFYRGLSERPRRHY